MEQTGRNTLLATAALVLLAAPSAQGGADADTTSTKIPVELAVVVDCDNDGIGDLVRVSGNLHILFHYTVNGSRVTLTEHFQPMEVRGFGETSGVAYNATGVTRQVTSFPLVGPQTTQTFVNRFHFVGTGDSPSFFLKQTQHLTFNAHGDLTSQVDNFDLTCE
jgi:hypothetical protein